VDKLLDVFVVAFIRGVNRHRKPDPSTNNITLEQVGFEKGKDALGNDRAKEAGFFPLASQIGVVDDFGEGLVDIGDIEMNKRLREGDAFGVVWDNDLLMHGIVIKLREGFVVDTINGVMALSWVSQEVVLAFEPNNGGGITQIQGIHLYNELGGKNLIAIKGENPILGSVATRTVFGLSKAKKLSVNDYNIRISLGNCSGVVRGVIKVEDHLRKLHQGIKGLGECLLSIFGDNDHR